MSVKLGLSILVVGDGFDHFGISLQPTQDGSNCNFTVSEFLYLLANPNQPVPPITVVTASRNPDPSAQIPNFVFTNLQLFQYSVIWLIGYEGLDDNNQFVGSTNPLSPAELLALTNFMNQGGGVFATGDHSGLGSYMCGNIPRVRRMRKWFSRLADMPPDVLQGLNWTGAVATMVNWSGVLAYANTPGIPRADTLSGNQSDAPGAFDFDDQSDDIFQTLTLTKPVHPIFAGLGAAAAFPDHMHEGEVVTPYQPGTVTIDGQSFTEFPANLAGATVLPQIVATGYTRPGHTTFSISDPNGGACRFTGDSAPSVGMTIGSVCAYDGWQAGVGRIVTDSSFHHLLDLNLIGNPWAVTADRQQGFGPAYQVPAANGTLAGMQQYYINTAYWLARPKRGLAASNQFGVAVQTDVFVMSNDGNIAVAWGDGVTGWNGPVEIGNSQTLAQGGGIAVSQRFSVANQTDVFSVDVTGLITCQSVVASGNWTSSQLPVPYEFYFPTGAYIAVSEHFGVPGQTDVFAVNAKGALTVTSNSPSNVWKAAIELTPENTFSPGAPVAASQRFGVANQTDVYAVDLQGRLRVTTAIGATWYGPLNTYPNLPPSAHLVVSNRFGVPNQTDVYIAANNGSITVCSVIGNGTWEQPVTTGYTGGCVPGGHLAVSNRFGVPNQTDVYFISTLGSMDYNTVLGNGAWNATGNITATNAYQPGAPVVAVNQAGNPDKTSVFAIDRTGNLIVQSVIQNGSWSSPAAI